MVQLYNHRRYNIDLRYFTSNIFFFCIKFLLCNIGYCLNSKQYSSFNRYLIERQITLFAIRNKQKNPIDWCDSNWLHYCCCWWIICNPMSVFCSDFLFCLSLFKMWNLNRMKNQQRFSTNLQIYFAVLNRIVSLQKIFLQLNYRLVVSAPCHDSWLMFIFPPAVVLK